MRKRNDAGLKTALSPGMPRSGDKLPTLLACRPPPEVVSLSHQEKVASIYSDVENAKDIFRKAVRILAYAGLVLLVLMALPFILNFAG